MRVPRIMWLTGGLATLLVFFTYRSAFEGDYNAHSYPSSLRVAADAHMHTEVAGPSHVSEDPAVQHRRASAASSVASAAAGPLPDRPSRPAVGLNASTALRPMTAVPPSRMHGTLSSGCTVIVPDDARRKLLQMVPAAVPPTQGGRPGCLEPTPICNALRLALMAHHEVGGAWQVVVTAAAHGQLELLGAFTEATAALRLPTLVLAMDEPTFVAARLSTAATVLVRRGDVPHGARQPSMLSLKWAALAEVIEAGASVLWADVDTVLASDPFASLYRDSDVEALSEGWDDNLLRGYVMGADDPSMGWSRYCESMRAAMLSPGLAYLHPTLPTLALANRLSHLADGWDDGAAGDAAGDADAEAVALSYELLMPAHDDTPRVGAKLRVMHANCWLHERAALSRRDLAERPAAIRVGRDSAGTGAGAGAGAVCRQQSAVALFHRGEALGPCWQSAALSRLVPVWTLERTLTDPMMSHEVHSATAKALVLRTKCAAVAKPALPAGAAVARRLNFVVKESSAAWPTNCAEQPDLCEVVKAVHRERTVMAAVSNRNILGMLGQFVETVQRAKVSNFLVVALDEATAAYLKKRKAPHYLRALRTRSGSTDNHATSGLKFRILGEILSVGASVLLTDVDVVLTQDPFPALYRDSDVEGMSDGWDEDTAYGYTHDLPLTLPQLKPGADASVRASSAPLRSVRMAARNSGLFYLSATHEAVRLMDILAKRMASEDVWDQSAYNMEVFRPAYSQYKSAGVSVRSMNYLCFANTKLVFKYMRHDAQLINPAMHLPVTVHINYHPEKEARMDSVSRFYHGGDRKALDRWNGGEGQRTGGCRGKVGVMTDAMPELTASTLSSHILAGNIVKASEVWTWGERGAITFDRSGALKSAAADGTWGTVPSPWRKDSLHVKLNGQTYLLMFLSEKWAFVAVRCSDEEVSYGRLQRANVPEKRLVF